MYRSVCRKAGGVIGPAAGIVGQLTQQQLAQHTPTAWRQRTGAGAAEFAELRTSVPEKIT